MFINVVVQLMLVTSLTFFTDHNFNNYLVSFQLFHCKISLILSKMEKFARLMQIILICHLKTQSDCFNIYLKKNLKFNDFDLLSFDCYLIFSNV